MDNDNTDKSRTAPIEEPMDWSDYVVAGLYVAIGAVFAVWLGRFYWYLHGGTLETFSFWTTGDKKWLEVLFWSLFTVHAWNITNSAWYMGNRQFQKRYVWSYIARTFEAPPISLALVFILINLGVSFGDTTVSMKDVPIALVIAFSIVSAYFSRETVDALQAVAKRLSDAVKEKIKAGQDTQPTNQ